MLHKDNNIRQNVPDASSALTVDSDKRRMLVDLADRLGDAQSELLSKSPGNNEKYETWGSDQEPTILIDSRFDTDWSHGNPGLSKMVHVFHQEWQGIRAAAGYLPGHKVAITADRPLLSEDVRKLVQFIEQLGTDSLVFHGFSRSMYALTRHLHRIFGKKLRFFYIWHGNTSHFTIDVERAYFNELLGFDRSGIVNRIGFVKPHMGMLSRNFFQKTIFNVPPSLPDRHHVPEKMTRTALIPITTHYWKNLFTTLLSADNAKGIDKIIMIADCKVPDNIDIKSTIIKKTHLKRQELFRLFGKVDVVLNVTFSECQPMTALEPLAFRTPCLTGLLGMDELDQHPYQRLVQVGNVGDLLEVKGAIEKVLEFKSTQPSMLDQMMADYDKTLMTIAFNRLEEFIQS